MILQTAQFLLVLAYVTLPAAFLIWAIVVRYRWGRSAPLIGFFLACTAAAIVGMGLLIINAHLIGGRISTLQSLQFLYFILGAICLVKLLDYWLLRGAFRAARVKLNPLGHPVPSHHRRALLVLLAQRAIVFALIIPYLVALMLTYRPKVLLAGDPKTRNGLSFAPAQFITRDGLTLAGWWIPAAPKPDGVKAKSAFSWGRNTVVICHGIGSAKERQLSFARFLADRGYNVLAFDFRGHGESAGNFISYGARERFDVLAAAQWAKANHADESQQVYGIGVNTGAAALLAAAADPEQGRQIDALVLFEPYARFHDLATATGEYALPSPVRWLVNTIGLPLASLHAGANLSGFAPAEFASSIWPRPVLLVHGRGPGFTPVYQEMDLYREMTLPKRQFWPAESYSVSRNRIRRATGELSMLTEVFRQWIGTSINPTDDSAIQAVTYEFLLDARPLPAI